MRSTVMGRWRRCWPPSCSPRLCATWLPTFGRPTMLEMSAKLPQLAKSGDPATLHKPVVEPKFDGHRVLAFTEADGDGSPRVRIYARTGTEKSGKLPAIEAALAQL